MYEASGGQAERDWGRVNGNTAGSCHAQSLGWTPLVILTAILTTQGTLNLNQRSCFDDLSTFEDKNPINGSNPQKRRTSALASHSPSRKEQLVHLKSRIYLVAGSDLTR